MTYQLTLTHGERKAIDWVGHRYSHGTDLYKLLCDVHWSIDYEPENLEFDWDTNAEITFHIPEHKAWEIQDLLEDSHFECFAGELVSKLLNFMGAIV